MATINVTPQMSLPVPIPGRESGPQYSIDITNCFTILDSHTHATGSGVQITPLAININSNLTFAGYSATNLAATSYATQLANSATSGSVFVKLGTESTPLPDLFYYDGTNTVQITSGGAIAATAAAIPGESYAGGTFTWKQGAGSTTPANFDVGSVTVRPNTAGTSNGVTLTPPISITSAYTVALPVLPSVSTSFIGIDVSGNMTATLPILGSLTTSNLSVTAGIVGTQLSGTAGIIGGQIANTTITASKIVAGTITNNEISTSTLDFGNWSASITNVVNVSSVGMAGQFIRVGTKVSCSGVITYVQGAGVGSFNFYLPLAPAANFSLAQQAGGTALNYSGAFSTYPQCVALSAGIGSQLGAATTYDGGSAGAAHALAFTFMYSL